MSNNKELVEKMTEAIARSPHKSETPEAKACIKICAAVASEHYGDKWVRVEDVVIKDATNYYFYNGKEVINGFASVSRVPGSEPVFALGEKGLIYKSRSGVTHIMENKLPQPPQQ